MTIQLNCEKTMFIADLVKLAKEYGRYGDYVEVREFVSYVIEEQGFNYDDFDLEPSN
jgi:hypothetical protein